MKGLSADFLFRAPFLQSTAASLGCFLPLVLLLLPLPPLESTVLPKIWLVFHGVLQEGPAFAFVLLNCVTVTIIAFSKLGSEKRGHGEESQRQLALTEQENENRMGDDGAESILLEGLGLQLDTLVTHGDGAAENTHESPTQKTENSHQPCQVENSRPAGEARHPTMEEVWASILLSKKGGERVHEEKPSKETNSEVVKQSRPATPATICTPAPAERAAALDPPTVASQPLLAPAATEANFFKAAKATAAPISARKPCEAAARKYRKGGRVEESGGEMEKLNGRAEEFIGRFNYQMRLQRKESLLRRRKGHRNYHDVHRVPHAVRVGY